MNPDFAERLRSFPADSPLQRLHDPFPEPVPVSLWLKRDDLLHPLVSGNKWRKLRYNLLAARSQGFNTLLTFGGAYSNHLYATAAAGHEFGFKTVGLVRGDELADAPRNPTLQTCEAWGMQLQFVSRTDYRRKSETDFLDELRNQYGYFYLIPEGGTNALAIEGTAEILPETISQLGHSPDYVCCSVGTGGTVSGLARSAPAETQVLGFLALNGPNFQADTNWVSITEYTFGGYAKTTAELITFIRQFEQKTGVLLEQVYTGKLLYGIYDLARKGYFSEEATVIALHTGGLQGRSAELDYSSADLLLL